MTSINFGEAWRVAEHIVACDDILEQDGRAFLARCRESDAPTMVYSDPPRNLKALKDGYKPTGREPPSYSEFMDLLFNAIAASGCTGSVFIEHAPLGGRFGFPIADAVEWRGGTVVKEWPTTYRGGEHRERLLEIQFLADSAGGLDVDLTGLDSTELQTVVMQQYEAGQVVLDICTWRKDGGRRTGDVWIADAALHAGHRYIGFKINPVRASDQLEALQRMTGADPVQLS